MIHLVLQGHPIPWKAPYVGVRGAFSPLTRIMNDLRLLLKEDYKGSVLEEPLSMDLKFYIKIPKSVSKKKKEMMLSGRMRPITTPDRDNLQKFVSDVLQGVVYKNDSVIVSGSTEKWYSESPRTEITIKKIFENQLF